MVYKYSYVIFVWGCEFEKNDKKLRIVLCIFMYLYFFKYKFKFFDLFVWYRDFIEIEFRWVLLLCLLCVVENII